MKEYLYAPEKYNTSIQECDGIRFCLIVYNAKRFMLVRKDGKDSRQNFWIPNTYLSPDGTVLRKHSIKWKFQTPEMKYKIELMEMKERDE